MSRTSEAAFDEADLNGFVDGRIDPARAAALAESLASDPESRARIDGWKRQNESLRTMFASVLFEPVPARLMAGSVPARPTHPEAAKPRDTGRTSSVSSGVLVTTSLGMALVGFALGAIVSMGTDDFGLSRPSESGFGKQAAQRTAAVLPTPARSLSDIAVEAHRTYLGDPVHQVELSGADTPRLTRWIQHRLGPTARVPDLTAQGWTLLGGRILPGPQGPVAFLVYADGADRLSLALSRSAGPRGLQVARDDGRDAVATTSWADEAFDYALTSGRGALWLGRHAGSIAQDIRAQAANADPLP